MPRSRRVFTVASVSAIVAMASIALHYSLRQTETSPWQSPGTPATQSHGRGRASHAPLSFEANAGQTAAPVKYLARGIGFAVFLTANEVVLALRSTPKQ